MLFDRISPTILNTSTQETALMHLPSTVEDDTAAKHVVDEVGFLQ